ncbi:hypothetical protein CEXT_308751 [Caerostris extrusa]|uniref:Uncharacterized protein n=1 Tax=Caerostris extrusa TaxID=172846 RepID=A0AAV4WK49_CAEEX|nr:hypothetical protein CEXT_308751 [Caerostris extrusa]
MAEELSAIFSRVLRSYLPFQPLHAAGAGGRSLLPRERHHPQRHQAPVHPSGYRRELGARQARRIRVCSEGQDRFRASDILLLSETWTILRDTFELNGSFSKRSFTAKAELQPIYIKHRLKPSVESVGNVSKSRSGDSRVGCKL